MPLPPTSSAPGTPTTKKGQISLENQRAIALQPFRAAIAGLDSAPLNIMFMGDSVSEGSNVTTVPARFQAGVTAGLRKLYQPSGVLGGANYIPVFYSANLFDGIFPAAAVLSGSPALNTVFGFGQRCCQLTGAQTVTWTVTGTSIDVVYVKGSGAGTLGISVDGGAVTNISEFNASNVDANATRITFSTRGTHTVVASSVSGTAYIDGIMVYDQDESVGIRSWDTSHYGTLSSGWAGAPLTAQAALATPALVVIMFGLNDWTSDVTPATFKANLNAIISALSSGYSKTTFVLQASYQRNTSGRTYTWQNMVDVMYDIAASNSSVIVHDLSKKMPPVAGDVLGFYYDTVHPNALGHRFIANELLEFLVGSNPRDTSTIPLIITTASANALAVGADGATNPVFKVDSSAGSVATGLTIQGKSSGNGLQVQVVSPGTNEALALDAKGSGWIYLSGSNIDQGIILQRAPSVVWSSGNGTSAALVVGPNGTGNPSLQVDTSVGVTAVTGLKIKSAAVAGGLAISTISSGTNENLTIDAKGTGTLTIAGTSTGVITLGRNTTVNGNLTLGVAGNKISITTGSNASAGTATLSGGTVTVSTTAVTANSLIFLTDTAGSIVNVGSLTVSSKSAGVSFTVNSTNVADTSTFNWFIIN